MISTQQLVPEVYYNKSRDFQALGRAFDVVFNYLKTNSDIIYNHPFSSLSDDRLVDLMTLTLGFKSRHNYNVRQLSALCSAFVYILRNKGNITSIETAINILLNAEGIRGEAKVTPNDNNTSLTIYVPEALTDLNLFNDLLVYIMPVGMGCRIVSEQLVKYSAKDEFATYSTISWAIQSSSDNTSNVPQHIVNGLGVAAYDDSIGNAVVVPFIDVLDRGQATKVWPKPETEVDVGADGKSSRIWPEPGTGENNESEE